MHRAKTDPNLKHLQIELWNIYQLVQEMPEEYPAFSTYYFPNLKCRFRKAHLDIELLKMVREREKQEADAREAERKWKSQLTTAPSMQDTAYQSPFRQRGDFLN